MKTPFIFISLALVCPAAAQEANRGFEEISGETAVVRVTYPRQLKRDKDWTDGPPSMSYVNIYDGRGRLVEEAQYSGKQLSLKKVTTWLDAPEAAAFCSAVKTGRAPETSFAETDGSALARFCKDSAKKKFTARFEHDGTSPSRPLSDRLIRRIFTFPDKKNRPAEEWVFDMTGAFDSRAERKYDKDGSLTGETVYNFDDLPVSRTVHTRDKAAETRTASVFNDRDQMVSRTVKAYRETGKLRKVTETTFDDGEQERWRNETSYDQKGYRAAEARYTGGAQNPDYEYEYEVKADKRGNWVRESRNKFVNFRGKRLPAPGEAPVVMVREITYR
ncbi:MAG: hypothetical protein FD189_1587 [Elusimicrobia bacterium]|nr:MAG: hypothetical protein FD154_1076 [Elusimicrobiota bacterium]KAF0154997.1 MAG: hypothetical protein FD189_1587 [Elusimicrobiota bacterium]